MDHRERAAGDREIDPAREAAEPGARVAPDLPVRMREPGGREALAGAARRKTAAALMRALRELLVAIAHDDVDAARPHEVDGRGGIAAIGDEIARADDARGRDAAPRGLGQHG